MPDGGTLTVSSTFDDNQLTLTIKDTGAGVSAENLDKLFTPLFSTKQNGLGLGLALTRRVIEEHGGKVRLESEPGRGSSVAISLPLDKEQ